MPTGAARPVPPRPLRALVAVLLLASCSQAPRESSSAPAATPPGPSPQALARAAEEALEAGRPEEALADAEAGLRLLDPRPREPRRDPALEVRLLVAAAGAQSDVGRPDLALPLAERAERLDPADAGAAWERAVALWELCRFGEAEAAFRRVLGLSPEDPWALHHLGLAAERRGDPRRARELMARATRLDPRDFPPEVGIGPAAFAAVVEGAIARLPAGERRRLAAVPLELAELPDVRDLVAVEPPLSPGILGLFRGPPEGEPCLPEDGAACRSIVLYRRNLARFVRDRRELEEQVKVTLLHELGHLGGEDDEALRRRGLE